METPSPPVVRQDARQPGIIHLSGALAAALCNRETLDRGDAIARRDQGGERRFQSGAERADNARRDDRHACHFFLASVTRWHGLYPKDCLFLFRLI
jgi:hypothetical protein